MCQSTQTRHLSTVGVNRRASLLLVAIFLILSPVLSQADADSNLLQLKNIAESNAAELGSVVANDHWTRVEFSNVYIDPVVVVETANGDTTYIAGVRNIDTMGFEINLKSCNPSDGAALQETINFSVVDAGQLPAAGPANTQIKQRFAWGECAGTSLSS